MMQQLFEFMLNHWVLWLGFFVVTILLLQAELSDTIGGIKLISPQEATQLMNHEDAKIVDIRQSEDYASGHILGAIHIPAEQLHDKLSELTAFKSKPIIISDQGGQQAPKIGATLRKESFEHIYALKGGILAWRGANLPLAKA